MTTKDKLGAVTAYAYDAAGNVTKVTDNNLKDSTYAYDENGNVTKYTNRENEWVQYDYDCMNRLVKETNQLHHATETAYDLCGNVTSVTDGNKHATVYTYDGLNRVASKTSAEGSVTEYAYHYLGESSAYLYNGLGALVENTWVIKKNAYGYHDVRVSAVVDGETVVDSATGKKEKKEKKTAEEVAASPTLNKTSTVVKQFVVDFTSETYKPLMEHEVNGLDYRYVYSDKARLSVVVQGIENGSASVTGQQRRAACLLHHLDGGKEHLSPNPKDNDSWK